ncbi:MAG: DUF4062 domain-containing protein [Rhizobium sp.]|nr:DUF4062 domain-containing protein [Rhizobium sp.]
MDVKYQIFVSSTFEDLKDERRAVIEAILNLGHIPVGMEVFQANDETQWTYIKNRIDESDYYVVIVAERYGSEQDGKSYTQMEYEYAIEKGVPTVAFLLDGEARKLLPQHKVEYDKRDKIEAFRQLCQQKLVRFWKNPDDLSGKVAMTLVEQMRSKPRTGWVKGDAVPSAAVLNELAALSEEKRQLQAQVDKLSASTELTIPIDVKYRIDQMQMTTVSSFIEGFDVEDDTPDLLEVFLNISNLVARGAESWEVEQRLGTHYPQVTNTYEAVINLSAELAAHKLMDVSRHPSKTGHTKVYTLTDYGKDFAMYAVHYQVHSSQSDFEK